MNYCKITLNKNTGRMHIENTMMFNGMVRGFPNRRFEKRRGIWVVPIIRRNAEHLVYKLSRVPGVTIEDGIMELCNQAIERVGATSNEPFPISHPFKTKPFPHQREALAFAWPKKLTAFFMEMGTGKTKTYIDLACARFLAGQINAAIVYCPVPLRTNWQDEWRVHASLHADGKPLYELFICDTTGSSFEKRGQWFIDRETDRLKVVVVGIESFQQGLERGKAFKFVSDFVRRHRGMQGVDESHKIKGHDANRAINIEILGREDDYKVIMTGTPICLGLTDLYQQFQFLSPDIIGIGDYYSFCGQYVEKGGFQNKQVMGYKNEEELMDLIKPFVFQVLKADVLKDLPPKTFTLREVEMTAEQKKVYADIKKNKCADLSKLVARRSTMGEDEFVELVCDNVLSAHLAMQQVTSGFVTYWHVEDGVRERRTAEIVPPNKNPKVLELLEFIEASGKKPIIVWARFRKEIDDLVAVLSGLYGAEAVCQYHGGLDPDQRDVEKRRFVEGDAWIFVSNQATGGTGLTLNKAMFTWYQSNTFVFNDRVQSEDRNHRIGQVNAVTYADCIIPGTVDSTIMKSIADKQDLANYVKQQLSSGANIMELLN